MDIRSLLTTSRSAGLLFEPLSAMILAGDVETTVTTRMQLTFAANGGAITHNKMIAGIRGTMMELEAMATLDHLPPRRRITAAYRGIRVPFTISSVQQEVDTRFWCMLRGFLVEGGHIPALFGEVALMPPAYVAHGGIIVHKNMAVAANASRTALNQAFKDSGVETADQLRVQLPRITKDVATLDDYGHIDLAIIKLLAAEGVQSRLGEAIIDAFPVSAIVDTTPGKVAAALAALAAGELFKLSSAADQNKLALARKVVADIEENLTPELTTVSSDPVLGKVVCRTEFLLVFKTTVKVNKKDEVKITRGKAAIPLMLEHAKKEIEAKRQDLSLLTPLFVFSFFTTDEQKAQAEILKAKIFELTGKTMPTKRNVAPKASLSRAQKKAKSDSAHEAALKLFAA